MPNSTFFAGAAREIITPPVGTPLFGYVPDWHSTSVHDDLTVTAAAFERGGRRAILLSATLCEIADPLADEIREKAGEAAGISPQEVILCATHTHSGPTTVAMKGWGPINREYCDRILIPQAVKAASAAWNARIPAKLGIGTTESRVGVNRRQIQPDGSVVLGQNPFGVFDPTMTVLALRGLQGEPILNLVHYGCHGTAAGRNREISRDWSGVMIDRLEKESGCLTVFFNGACGDTGPRLSNGLTVGDISHVIELGSVAAQDAVRCYRGIREFRTDPDVRTVTGEICLPYRDLPSPETTEAEIAAICARCDPDTLVNIDRLTYEHWCEIRDFHRSGKPAPDAFRFPQTLLAVGPVLFVPFPYEIFGEITLRLREYSPYPYTLSLSNANGAHAYFPSRDQIPLGGYEIMTFTSSNLFCLTDDADNRILAENLSLIRSLGQDSEA